ncbi:MAG: sortase [Clostridia bacterium]|nr:sortase [Clostridia bacterium]
MKKQSKGKHFTSKKKKTGYKKILLLIPIIALVILTIFIFINYQNQNNNAQKQDMTMEEKIKIMEEEISNMPETMGDYNVLGVIAIEKLGIAKNILDRTTDESLNLSVTKFYGPDINTEGNFCITGHNYKDVFSEANQLELEDTFYLVDRQNQKVTYKIYDKYTVDPTQLDCLSQETDGKKEVTLITCNPGGLTRLIIKAQEI